MPPTVPDSQLTLPQLFTELQKNISKQELKGIIKYSNMILHTKGTVLFNDKSIYYIGYIF